jgi:signal transduction histidine kinase
MFSSPEPQRWTVFPPWNGRPQKLDAISVVVSLLAAAVEPVHIAQRHAGSGGYLALAVTVAGVILSRKFPWPGVVAVAAGSLVAAAFSWDPLVLWTIAVFTVFSVTLRGLPGPPVGLVVAATVFTAVVVADGLGPIDPIAFTAAATSLAAAGAGSAVRSRQRYLGELQQRNRDALRRRDAETKRRVTEERLRIARDLHDLVGHEVALLGIHLGVAEVNLPEGAVEAREAVESARTGIQAVLQETQRILHVLRSDDPNEDLSRPSPAYAGILELVRSFRDAGAQINAELCEAPSHIDTEVSSAAYRIVQEALTNSQRHGQGPVTVTTNIEGPLLIITALNAKPAGRPESGSTRGYGLIGMRERAISAGGQLLVDDGERMFRAVATLRLDRGALG